MLVKNWINKTQICININICPLFEDICRLMKNLDSLICHHVYSERNTEAYKLSKGGLKMEQGTWKIMETGIGAHFEYYHKPFMDLQHS